MLRNVAFSIITFHKNRKEYHCRGIYKQRVFLPRTLPQNTMNKTQYSLMYIVPWPLILNISLNIHLNICSLPFTPHLQSLISPFQDNFIFNLPLHFLLQLLNLHILVRFIKLLLTYQVSSEFPSL